MLRNEIRAASAEERDPSRVLVFAKHCGDPTQESFELDGSPKLWGLYIVVPKLIQQHNCGSRVSGSFSHFGHGVGYHGNLGNFLLPETKVISRLLMS